MLLTILVSAAVLAVLIYLGLNKKKSKLQEPEIKHVIAEVDPVDFESEQAEWPNPEPVIESKAKKTATKKTATKKPAVKKTKATKDGK